MQTKKEITVEKERLSTLKEMVESYEEIAASRMRRIRDSVLITRNFLSEINEIYHHVQASYKKEVERLMKEKRIKDPGKFTFLKRNGKTICLLLSANTGLYGNIIKSTYDLFIDYVKKEKSDVIIIGKLGYSLFQKENLGIQATTFDMPDSKIDLNAVSKIIEYILKYEKIIVFHGEFRTIITQRPKMSVISGDVDQTESVPIKSGSEETQAKEKVNLDDNIRYIFEPTLETIMSFFESEIFASIFEQTVHESELAKFSSRMVVLDIAVDNIKGELRNVNYKRQMQRHRAGNRKQLARLSGMSLWGI